MAANVRLNMTGDQRKLARELAKSEANIDKLKEKLATAGKTGKKAGKDISGSFVSTKLRSMIAGLAGTAGLVALLNSAETAAKGFKDRLSESVGGLKDLVQLSVNFSDKKANEANVNKLRTRFGFSETAAQGFNFSLLSQGLTRKDVLDAGALREFEKDPRTLALAVGKLRAKFGKGVLGGTFTSAAGALGLAGTRSPVSAAELANVALQPLAIGKELGFRPESVLASVALGTQAAETPEQGRTQIAALFGALLKDKKRRFEGIGLAPALRKIKELPEQQRRQLFSGRKEALLGFGLLERQIGDITGFAGDITRETKTGGFVERKRRLARLDPKLQAQLQLEKAKASKEIAGEPLGLRETIQQTLFEKARAITLRRGTGAIGRGTIGAAIKGLDIANPSPETIASTLGGLIGTGGKDTQTVTEELFNSIAPILQAQLDQQRQMVTHQQRTNANLDKIEQKSPAGAALVPATEDTPPGA